MRKNFLLTTAVMVTAFFVGTTIAQAVSVEWGGSLRPRFEYNEQAGFNQTQNPPALTGGGDPNVIDTNQGSRNGDYFVSTQIRLQAKVDILPDTSAFIQLQSVRNYGNDLNNIEAGANTPQLKGAGAGLGGSTGGSGNASFSPSDNDNSVGVHQAYFTLKNFATLPVDLKLGRQEIILDGHRIFGNTVWTQGMQSHDAVRLTHHQGNLTVSYMYILANEAGRTAGAKGINDNGDIEVHTIYANMKGILGGGLSLYFVGFDDSCSNGGKGGVGGAVTIPGGACRNTAATPLQNNMYTVGLRQAGQLFGIDYRGEFYYQFGDAEGEALNVNGTSGANPNAYTTNVNGVHNNVNRSAYMFGARIGKKFNNVMWKPSLTFWYDYLSGTSDQDARNGDMKTFNTLFDTGHKFYGLMDLFLAANGAGTKRLGLVDYAIKASVQPAKAFKLKAAWHYFTTAESIDANSRISGVNTLGRVDNDNNLGNEIDVTLVHKYNANTTISAGWSHYSQTQGFELVNGAASQFGNPSGANWAYLMFHVKF